MDWFIDIEDCCGCGACEQVCPVGCIAMTPNQEGFLYPLKDSGKCIQCKRCEKVCPIANYQEVTLSNKHCYIFKTPNEVLREGSSSGGLFTHLAEFVLDKDGIVFGAAFDNEWMVKTIGVEHKESLRYLRGSKYLAASVEHTYIEAKSALRAGRWVLYSGTPCQIAGLTHFLGAYYPRLIAVEIMCHGVPSPKVWKLYLDEIASKNSVKNVSFRNKFFGWNRYAIMVESKNNVLLHEPNDENIYMQGFLLNLYNRISCSHCCARGFNNAADLTIGDYWELEKQDPKQFDNKGMSLVIVHTQKGAECLREISKIAPLKQVDFQAIITSGNHDTLIQSAKCHPGRNYFFRHLNDKKSIVQQIDTALHQSQPRSIRKKIVKKLKEVLGNQYCKIQCVRRKRLD